MVEEFKEGYYYRVWPPTDNAFTNITKLMKSMLDGKWRKCKDVSDKSSTGAEFEGISGGYWFWGDIMPIMEEVSPKEILKGMMK